jgi:hypothetical protein
MANLELLKQEGWEEFEEARWNHTQDGMYWAFPVVEGLILKAYRKGVEDRNNAILERIASIEQKILPLKQEYDHEYKMWFTHGIKTPAREKLLKEYETGAKGNQLFSLQEKKEVLESLLLTPNQE